MSAPRRGCRQLFGCYFAAASDAAESPAGAAAALRDAADAAAYAAVRAAVPLSI